MNPSASPSSPESALYRRVWRWHFYAGLICLPVLALMAVTGALYLYKSPIESFVYRSLRFVEPSADPRLDAETLVARALSAHHGTAVRFIAPVAADRSAEVGVKTAAGAVTVYLEPTTGRVLGDVPDARQLMNVVKRIHSLAIAGPVFNHGVEVVAGWAIVLVVSGLFLWWPRGRSRGSVYSVRGRVTQRLWWRDLHAVTGAFAGVAILFLAVTGMPWSAFWGQQFGRITNDRGVGLPKHLFGPAPASTPPMASLGGNVPWTLMQAPMPQSTAPDAHAGHGDAAGAAPVATSTPAAASLGLNDALRRFATLGVPEGTPVSLPVGPLGVFSAKVFPDDVRGQRVVHLDRYSGAVLADVGYADYGVAGRAVEWGVNLHTGQQFGGINRLVMLAGCLSIVLLAVSAVVMWWKRRPRGRLAAPPRREGDRAARGAMAVAVVLGLVYPLLGVSMLVALGIDAIVPRRWQQRFGF